jgi:superfamily II DNA or RNA helicase
MPTGSGKTVCFTYMAEQAQAKDKRVLLLAHRKELVSQISGALKAWGVHHGVIRADTKPSHHSVQVAMVQTLANRIKLDKAGRFKFDLVIIDEAHHATKNSTWGAILAHNAKAKMLGVTATPCRLDGKGLGIDAQGFFDAMVLGPTVSELIERGNLARPVVYAPSQGLDLSGVKQRGGDYIASQLVGAVDRPGITGDAVAHYRRYCDNQAAIAFTITVSHAGHVVEQFKAAGYQAAVLTGSTPDKERAQMIKDLGTGQLQVLASCNVVSEGTDIPAVAAAILLRPTASYALAMQQIGRALRALPGKSKAIILDHADNVRRHGLPTDAVEWSLSGLQRKKSKGSSLIKTCNGCGALVALRTTVCADCGYTFHAANTDSPDKAIIEQDGELVEMTPEMIEQLRRRKRTELIGARSREQLVKLGQDRNYKKPGFWADKIIEGREQHKAQYGRRV